MHSAIYKIVFTNIVAGVFLLIGLSSYWQNLQGTEFILAQKIAFFTSIFIPNTSNVEPGWYSGIGIYEERAILIGLIFAALLMAINIVLLHRHAAAYGKRQLFAALYSCTIALAFSIVYYVYSSALHLAS